jgi:hypothetical protein
MGGFPALQIRPPESPLQQAATALQLQGEVQRQQLGNVQLEEARLNQQSQQALMEAYTNNNGDLNATYAEAVKSGKVTPQMLLNFRTQSVAAQVQMANLSEKELTNLSKVHDMEADALEAVKGVPVEQRGAEIKRQLGVLINQGVDPNQLLPTLNANCRQKPKTW